MTAKPLIALAMGDPAGISPELTAKLVAQDDIRASCRLVVIGDRRIFDEGARVAGVRPDMTDGGAGGRLSRGKGRCTVRRSRPSRSGDGRAEDASLAGGRFALANYRHALELGRDGRVDAVCFTPLQQAGDAARPRRVRGRDRILGRRARAQGAGERVQRARPALERAGHLARADRARSPALSARRILDALELTAARCARPGSPGRASRSPALNPHAGDGGNFGREEIEIIAPAVAAGAGARASRSRARSRPTPCSCAPARRLRCRAHDVSRPGPDRDQADGLRSRRDVARRLAVPDHHARARHRLRHRGQGHRDMGASRAALLLAAEMAQRRVDRGGA